MLKKVFTLVDFLKKNRLFKKQFPVQNSKTEQVRHLPYASYPLHRLSHLVNFYKAKDVLSGKRSRCLEKSNIKMPTTSTTVVHIFTNILEKQLNTYHITSNKESSICLFSLIRASKMYNFLPHHCNGLHKNKQLLVFPF